MGSTWLSLALVLISNFLLNVQNVHLCFDAFSRSVRASINEILSFAPIECKNPESPPINSQFLGMVNSSLSGTQLTVICNDSFVISPGIDRVESRCTCK